MDRRRTARSRAGPVRETLRVRLRDAIDAYCAVPHEPTRVADTLRQLAVEAKQDGIPAETLVVALRNLWHERVPCGPMDVEATASLVRLVGAYLTTHYGPFGSGEAEASTTQ